MAHFEPRYRDLVSLFEASARRFPERPLFGTKRAGRWDWLSYRDFAAMVDRCRAGLAACGVGAGDRVACVSNNRVEWACAAYATYGRGAAYVALYEAQQEKEWLYILRDAGARVAFAATPAIAAKLEAMKPELPALTHVVAFDAPESDPASFAALLARGAAAPVPSAPPAPEAIAAMLYTSGTTGAPKGVKLSHANLALNVEAAAQRFPVMPDDRSLSFLPWAHAFGQTCELHMLVAAGASLGLCEGIPKLIDNLAEVRPTVLMAVPNVFHKIHDGVRKQLAAAPAPVRALFDAGMAARAKVRRGEPLGLRERLATEAADRLVFRKVVAKFGGRLRFAMSGGAALDRTVAEFVDNLGVMVFEGYGLTETSPIATANTPAARKLGSAGKPLPGVRIEIDASKGDGAGEGEIIVHGHNVMQGYHGLPDEDAKVFTPDGGFRTGDLGRLDAEGFLFVTGRVKELYKLQNGKYVAPAPLEAKLQLSPYVAQALVHGANRPHNVALLVPKMDALEEWARAEGIDASDPARLVREPRVKALLRRELDAAARDFKGFEAIRDFVVTHEAFTVENDMLTPKLSTKRRNVLQRHGAALEALYPPGA